MFRYLVLVVVMGCASAAPVTGEPGPQGEQGIQGPAGKDGLQGPMGPVGPTGASAIRVQPLPVGTLCATGGVLLSDADGGSSALCNGSQGDVGPTGAVGAQGPIGISPPSLVLRDTSGGIVGSVYSTSTNSADFVFVESTGCVAQIDYTKNSILPIQANIYYTQANCTGIAFTRMNGNTIFPVGCLGVGHSNAFKAQQPVLAQVMNGQSVFRPNQFLADGGITTTCEPLVSSGVGTVVESVPFPNLTGPFTFGAR